MAMTQDMERRVQLAVEYFMQGYGCCQSIVAAFCDLYGLTPQQAFRIGAGFGGGIGKMRMVCGAVSGTVILAGLQLGNEEGSDREGKALCYKAVQSMIATFKEENGSVICAELLGMKAPSGIGDHRPSERNEEYYRTRPCAAKVESAARIFAGFVENAGE